MNLWHIQLHPTGATTWTTEDTRRIVATGLYRLLGQGGTDFRKAPCRRLSTGTLWRASSSFGYCGGYTPLIAGL